MTAFNKIIGYEEIKKELIQICDMIHNKEIYEKLGAKLPQGFLLLGDPGLGKTLMAKCFIEECGIPYFTLRRNQGSVDFINTITKTFEKARENTPSIIFLDDMDKFADEDKNNSNAHEYVAIQSAIDDISNEDIFVIATANSTNSLPESLLRCGRFDKEIDVLSPSEKDSANIIKYFLKAKKLADDVNFDDITKMVTYKSCAELETIANAAAIEAGFERRESISMKDLKKAVLRKEYGSPDSYTKSPDDVLKKTAIHEAGHLVVCETIMPGSVGIISLQSYDSGKTTGFIRRCKKLPEPKDQLLVSLAGKAAEEYYFPAYAADGCYSDLKKAKRILKDEIEERASCGLGNIDFSVWRDSCESSRLRGESVLYAEFERYMFKTKDILFKNKDFLEKITDALLEKGTLLYSEIQAIRESVGLDKIPA